MNRAKIIVSAAIALIGLQAAAVPGDLDPSFGSGGQVITAVGSGDDRGHAVALQSDGKLVVAGYSYNGSNNDFAVLRYNVGGTLDTSFGTAGKVITDFGGSNDIANGVALQSDGKIIAVGRALAGSTSPGFALVRYHPDGSLDTNFGPAGTGRILTVIGVAHAETQARSVKLQSDGKILVAGHARPTGTSAVDNQDFALLRYNNDGSLDNGFGVGGLVTTQHSGYDELAFDVAVQQDGKIVFGGNVQGYFTGALVSRYLSDGTPDTGFGTAGQVFYDYTTLQMVSCHAIALQADGKIVLAGGTIGGGFCLRRCNANGTVDSTFGSNGLVVTQIGTAAEVSYDLALQSDGKLVAVGQSYNANTGFTDFAVVRYNANGSLDTTFSGTGRVTTSFPGGSAVGRSVVIGPDGRIVMAGYAHDGAKNNFALARYDAEGSLVMNVPSHLSHTNNSQPLIAGKASPGFTVNVHINGSVVGSTVADGSGAWSLTVSPALADGVHTAAVTETDGFGSTGPLSSTVSFTVDTQAPVAPIITSPAEAALIHSSRPVVTGTSEPGSTVAIYFDDTVVGSAFASSLGIWSFTPTTALVNGQHTVKAAATDRAGNTGVLSGTTSFSTLAALFGGPGNPDTSFGGSGQLVTSVGSGNGGANGVALQNDGKVVAVGYSYNGSNNDFAVLRYNADGTLDTTFNGSGKATANFGVSNDTAHGVAIQLDGKIVAVGSALAGSNSGIIALARFNPDGSLDTHFGSAGTGRITTAIGVPHLATRAERVTVLPNGKILVAGHARPTGTSVIDNQDFALLRYNSDGTLDNSFGAGGMVTAVYSYQDEYAYDVAVQQDGKIVFGGNVQGYFTGALVSRYLSDGTPDIGFGTAGQVFYDYTTLQMVSCHAIALQADGKIVLAGGTIGGDFCLRRCNANGTVDSTFGINGLAVTQIGTAAEVSYDLALQSDGKLVAVGQSYNANTGFTDFAVVRYNANGSLDTTFRGTGRVTTSFPGGNAVGRSVVIGPDGRIVIAGYAHDGTRNNFALARFFGTDQPPQVTTGAASGIVRAGAVLNGIVNPNNLVTTACFEYGLTTSYGSVTADLALGNGYLDVPASSVIGGLTDNTLYHYRIVATNAAGTSYGVNASFTTAPNPPLTFTGDASNVNANGATLVGVVIPNGRVTTAYFEFGLSTVYGTQTDSQMIPAEGTVENVFAPLTGLVAGATYHFRLVAINAGSPIPINGVDKTFVAQAPPPVVALGSASPLTTTSVSLSGTVNANNASTQVFFDYGTDGVSFPNSVTAAPATVTGNLNTAVAGSLLGLSQGVIYHYRLRALNPGGQTLSGVATFTLDLLSGLTQSFPSVAPDAEGILTVNLTPAGILHGWRFVGEQQWRASGVAALGLTAGDREIEFRPVPGYIHPPAESAISILSDGSVTVLTRDYFETTTTGSGGLSVTLKPDSILSGTGRAQWRLLGEDDAHWRDSEATLTGLIPGSYLIESKPVAGRATPPNVNVIITAAQTAVPTITYFRASTASGALPAVLAFETVTADTSKPYAFVGQIRSHAGSSTGFAVKERVVATAAHVVFDDGTLSAAQGLQWLFQRHRGTYEPKAQIPRGFYLLAGYSAQRALENTPGSFSPQSRNLDAAAMYFLEDAARTGHSGFLASDLAANEFLLSNASKILVGYPIDGIATGSQGRMHATTPANILFSAVGGTPDLNRTFITTGIRSSGGASGGPVCVQFEGAAYYPAAIYLGGVEQTIVRAIDSTLIDLFTRAELSSIDDQPHTGGGITHTSVSTFGSAANPGAIKVLIEPAGAITAGAGWRLSPETSYRQSGAQKSGLNAGNYVLQLPTVAGYPAPDPQSVTVTGGQLATVTFTYGSSATPLESWRQTHFGTTANSGNAADAFDFDKDGLSNLIEWACNLNPTSASALPVSLNSTGANLEFNYTRSVAALNAGVLFTVEWSDTLVGNDWHTTGVTQVVQSDSGTVQQVKATLPAGSTGQRFVRLKVTGVL